MALAVYPVEGCTGVSHATYILLAGSHDGSWQGAVCGHPSAVVTMRVHFIMLVVHEFRICMRDSSSRFACTSTLGTFSSSCCYAQGPGPAIRLNYCAGAVCRGAAGTDWAVCPFLLGLSQH